MKPNYIFIVGLPRTGTKMLKNILQRNPIERIGISHENFYMGHSAPQFINPGIRKRLKNYGNLKCDQNVAKLVDHMYEAKFVGTYWELLSKGRLKVEKANFLQKMLSTDRSEKSIYRVIMQMCCGANECLILGDRTPSHLYHVPKLFEWFPNTKIIQTTRDPRAITASQLKRLLKRVDVRPAFSFIKAVYALIIVIYLTISWMSSIRLYYKYKKLFPSNYYIVKFEDIVLNPEKEVMKLCEFLEIEYHKDMLNPDAVGSSYDRDMLKGFDTGAVDRWRHYLSPRIKKWIEFSMNKYMNALGYDTK